jgi:uncharacterized protein (TIGR02001 family)
LDSSSPNTAEISFGLNYKWLSVKAGQTLTKFYGWNPNNSGLNGGFAGDLNAGVTGNTRGSHYMEANGSYEIGDGWVINGQLGSQTIVHSQGLGWTYYKMGVTKNFTTGWSANLSYSGSSKPDAYQGFIGLTNNGAKRTVAESKILYSLSYNF